MGQESSGRDLAFAFLGGALLLFIAAPIAGLYLHSGPGALARAAQDPELRASIWLSLWTSMAATMLCALLAVPLAHLLARKSFPLHGLVNALIDVPVIIPHSAAGIALLGVVARGSWSGRLAGAVGLGFVDHPAGIMLAMAFVSVPFLVNAARDGFAAVPARLERIALSLGASPVRVFFTVSVPLAWRSILSGFILMWARGMSEFGAVVIVAYNPKTAPVLIFERFNAFGLTQAVPAAAVLVAVSLLIFAALRLVKEAR